MAIIVRTVKRGNERVTKGEYMNKTGLMMLRKDLDEEVDDEFIKCMEIIKQEFRGAFPESDKEMNKEE